MLHHCQIKSTFALSYNSGPVKYILKTNVQVCVRVPPSGQNVHLTQLILKSDEQDRIKFSYGWVWMSTSVLNDHRFFSPSTQIHMTQHFNIEECNEHCSLSVWSDACQTVSEYFIIPDRWSSCAIAMDGLSWPQTLRTYTRTVRTPNSTGPCHLHE